MLEQCVEHKTSVTFVNSYNVSNQLFSKPGKQIWTDS